MKTKKRFLSILLSLALVLGLMPGMSMTAYAAPTETLLTTITATAKEQASYSTEGVATVSFSYTTNGSSAYMNNGTTNWGWWGYGWTATVTPADGYTITKCVFYDDANRKATDSEAPFVVETTEEDKTPKVNGTPILANQSKGITKIEVYGYATPATVDPVPYMAWNGSTLEEKDGDNACKTYTVVTVDTTAFEDGKWYVVSDNVTVSSRITVTGTAHLILCDGATLTASKGITVNNGNTINIYAQSGGTGELSAGNDVNTAGIGGGARYQSGGTINIHGGKITANGGSYSSGIGGALDGGNGEVNIYSGEVTAQGQNFAAGIGGYSGKSGGTVNIYGGTVNASGSKYGTTGIGIGGTEPGSCVVHIYGGEVTATSEKAAAGIQGTVTIDGGTVTANGGGDSNLIDCYSGETYSSNGISGTVTINGGTVSATGGNVTGEITNFGGNIYACNGIGGTVTINGGTVTATGGSHTGNFENHRGTTVKEKGFGGSLTLGTGMYLYGGTSANPESNLSNYRAGAGDYTGDRYVYMTVNNVVPHIHSFTYTADGATVTATCGAEGCDLTSNPTLTIVAPTLTTYGQTGEGISEKATLDGLDAFNSATDLTVAASDIKYYGVEEYEIEGHTYKKQGDELAQVPTAAGEYVAGLTLSNVKTSETETGDVIARVWYTIAPASISSVTVTDITAPVATEALDTEAATSTANVTLGAVTWNPTTTPAAYATQYTATVIATAAANYAFADTVTATVNGQAATVTKNDGGTLTIAYTFEKTALTPVTITATDKKADWSADGIAIPVEGMFTITEGAGAATYTVTNGTGEGTYDAQTGKLTVTKCGTFTVKVSTAATDTYAAGAETTATLTVNKVDSTAATVTANTLIYTGSAQALVTVTGEATGGTMQYALGTKDAATEEYTTSIPTATNAGTYYMWYKVVGDENHSDTEAKCVTVSISKAVNLKPILSETKIVTTSTSIQINGFYNASSLDEAKYQYSLDGGKKWTAAENSTTHTFSGLTDGTTYQLRVRTVETANTEGVETSDILSVTTPRETIALTAVTIRSSGGDKTRVGDNLTAVLTPANATGVTYQWYYTDGTTDTEISGATGSSYLLTGADYDKTLKVKVSEKSATSETVGQAPKATLNADSIKTSATQTTITVSGFTNTPTRHYEYSKDGTTWQDSNELAELTQNTNYTVYVRTGSSTLDSKWQEIGEAVSRASVSTLAKPYPFDAAPTVSMTGYNYGTSVSPTLNGTLKDGAGAVKYYYSRSAFTGTTTGTEWTGAAANALDVGTYFMRAVIAESDTYAGYTTDAVTFTVGKSPATTPETTGLTLTDTLTVPLAANDRTKALEYYVGTSAPDSSTVWTTAKVTNGAFTVAAALNANANYHVYLRTKGDSNHTVSAVKDAGTMRLAEFTVAYDANGGTGAPAAQTGTTTKPVTVYAANDKANSPTRSGYTFSGWFDGSTNVSGQTVSVAKTLKAKWTANTYTIAFNANGGTGTMNSMTNVTYGAAAQPLTESSFTRESYIFAGWATSANGSVVYTNGQNVKNLTSVDKSTVTLYAVWVDNTKSVSGTVESGYPGSVELKLMRGSTQVGGTQVVTLELKDSGKYEGDYSFTDIPNGSYNLVAMQVVAKAGGTGTYEESLTRTAAVTVSGSGATSTVSFGTNNSGRIVMPSGDTSSLVEVKEDTPPVIVGGLDTVAENQKVEDRSVNVTMSVESRDKATATDEETKDAIDAIENLEIGETEELSYLNIGIEKEVVKDGTTESKEPITETGNVITITIPYDMTGRSYYQMNMYRHHDNIAERFPDASRHHGNGAPTQTYEDGHFYIDVAGNTLYLYAKKFSTYAISFDPGATAPSSETTPAKTPTTTPTYSTEDGSSDSDDYLNTVVKTNNGSASVNRGTASSGEKVTITIKPDTGYTVDTVTVGGSANRSVSVTKVDDSTYTYIQPGMDVKINVTFRAVTNTAWTDCSKNGSCPINQFTDADAKAWYHDGVHWALENGVMNGVGNNKFNPSGETSRAMVVTMLWRLEGSPAYAGASEFYDVDNEQWYGQAVRWASADGIVGGYRDADGKGKMFNPNGAVTREQLVTMLYRYVQYKGQGFAGLWSFPLNYPDAASVSDWAYEAMCWMTMNGVINGMDGKLAPAANASRAQVATMFMRYCTEAMR